MCRSYSGSEVSLSVVDNETVSFEVLPKTYTERRSKPNEANAVPVSSTVKETKNKYGPTDDEIETRSYEMRFDDDSIK